MKRPRSKRTGASPAKASSAGNAETKKNVPKEVESRAPVAEKDVDAEVTALNATEENTVDFSQLRGIGEDSDESDPDEPLRFVDVSKLPAQVLSEHRNDEPALDKKLADIALFDTAEPHGAGKLPFRESLSVAMPMEGPLAAELAVDDLARERKFAELATAAVHIGLGRLRAEKVKFRRPDDYFAQMIKSDEHMTRVKTRMLGAKESIQNAQRQRHDRELVKNKKKVRQEQRLRQQEKLKQTKDEIAAVSKLRKERVRRRAEAEEPPSDDDEFPIDLLNVEQLDSENRFQPAGDIASGKKKAWRGNVKVDGGKKGGKGKRVGKGQEEGKRDGPVGIKRRGGRRSVWGRVGGRRDRSRRRCVAVVVQRLY